jgi:glycosyltransferase involved in cell wall biosynthesis
LIGTVGRLEPVKGHADLVATMMHLPDEFGLAIAGNGSERASLEQRGADAGIAHRLHFLGHVDGVEHLLPAFDVFCLPSHSEGFPRSVIEAQACNIPVIATDVGALREAVCSITGCLVPARNPIALAKAVQDLLAVRSSCAPSPSPRSFVEHRYTWTRTAAAYARVMELPHVA